MSNYTQGICETMCPMAEIKLRTKENLLHFYEMKIGQKNVPDQLVKEFSRSAAGHKAPRKQDLRTFQALQKTIEYLLKTILLDERKSFYFAYDFIFDRLRCIRQEIVIQNFDLRQTIQLLEPMILFLAYSRYRLCEEKFENFDPAICEQHLQECLKRVLCCYDEFEEKLTNKEKSNRIFIESLYQIFNMGSTESLLRSLRLNCDIRKDSLFSLSRKISMELYRKNYFKSLALINKLPHILSAVGSLKFQFIRRQIYLILSHAYSSQILTVPAIELRKLLFHDCIEDVLTDCNNYNVEIRKESTVSVRFSKKDFNIQKSVVGPKRERCVEEKLEKLHLPEVLLLQKL